MNTIRRRETLFAVVCGACVFVPLLLLVGMVGAVVVRGFGRLDLSFLTSYPSRHAELAGLFPALVGSALLVAMTAALALPIGGAAAIWLEEYGGRSRLARFIELNVHNLAGVPSVVYGILGLGVFVRVLGLGHGILSGAATLALLVLPVVIVASRESLRAVPSSLRDACAALGATQWQAVRTVVVPAALPGMLTGAVLALSRAVGETAPLIVVGAVAYVTFLPTSLDDPFTALPIQIFHWVARPQAAFVTNAAAGILVLLAVVASVNILVSWVRDRAEQKVQR